VLQKRVPDGMKVIHQTARQLVIEDRPWLIGVLLIAMALCFLAAGMATLMSGVLLGGMFMLLLGGGVPLLIAGMLVQRVRMTFDRDTGQVTRTCKSLAGLTRTSHALHRLERARVGARTDSDGATYRMELDLRNPPEVVPFTSYYTNGKRPEKMAQAVNGWLAAGRQPVLSVRPTGNR
jgi:hypothetical protein